MHQIIFSLMASFSARCELQFSERNLTKSERKARLDNSFWKMILLNEPKKMLSRRKIYHFRKMVEKRGGGGGGVIKILFTPSFLKLPLFANLILLLFRSTHFYHTPNNTNQTISFPSKILPLSNNNNNNSPLSHLIPSTLVVRHVSASMTT